MTTRLDKQGSVILQLHSELNQSDISGMDRGAAVEYVDMDDHEQAQNLTALCSSLETELAKMTQLISDEAKARRKLQVATNLSTSVLRTKMTALRTNILGIMDACLKQFLN